MTRLENSKERFAREAKEQANFSKDETAQQEQAAFGEWLKQHLISHPQDAEKDENELKKIYQQRER